MVRLVIVMFVPLMFSVVMFRMGTVPVVLVSFVPGMLRSGPVLVVRMCRGNFSPSFGSILFHGMPGVGPMIVVFMSPTALRRMMLVGGLRLCPVVRTGMLVIL